MKKQAVLTLMEGSFERGFPVILQIGSVGTIATAEVQVSGMLPNAPKLWEVFQHWQSAYHQMVLPQSRIKAKKAQVTNISCRQLSFQLADCLNEWLNSGTKEWQKIRDSLQRHLNSTDEIEVFIQTRDRRLRQLPWQVWDFFEHYPHAEVALSTPEYQTAKLPRSNGKARVLAILGDSTGIDVEKDRAYLNRLSTQAQIEFLVEPQLEQLDDRLWSQGWDILFFAGHSSSQEEGRIWLNKTESITIAQLRYGLQKAVKNGLRLAILNSCDGLSLAEKLADLQIGQTIVMREPVPDAIAQAFLKYFLTAFTSGQSLYTAVREARNRLLILEKDFPYASWLPVIFAHPAEPPPTWQELCGSKQRDCSLPLKRRLFAALIGSVAVTTLTIGIRQLGILQAWELQAFDRLMQLRPPEPPDPRLLIVTITGKDVQDQDPQERRSSSLSERSLEQLLEKLQLYHPRVIGLDIYRDFPVSPQYKNLKTYLETNKSFVGVCKVGETQDDPGIRPAPELTTERLSFSNFPVDRDRVIRRQLLGMAISPKSFCQTDTSFSFRVAQLYLAQKGISFQRNSEGNFEIDRVVFKKLQSDSGSYQNLDALGYQVLLNYRAYPEAAEQITLDEILNRADNNKLRELVEDRIVLIGTVAKDFKDYHSTPYSEEDLPGVTIQAHMISQILSAVEDERSLIWWLPNWGEVVWIWGWALLGGITGSLFRTPLRLGLVGSATLFVLYGSCFVVLLSGGWIPLIPSALSGIVTGAIIVVAYIKLLQLP